MFPTFRPRHMGLVKGLHPVLCSSIALPDGGVPEWLHLLPAGAVRTVDGRGPYHVKDAVQLMAASIPAGGKIPLDENHATDLAAPKGGAAPARGWIVELQSRSDGIWGRVEWTGTGRRMMEDREYRGVSPVIAHGKDMAIGAILRASLTNTPNLAGLVALHSQENTMDFRAWLIEHLGLDADAGDEAIVTAMTKAIGAKPDAVALQSALAPIAALVGVAGNADAAAVLAGVQRLKDGGDENATIVSLQSELVGVTNTLNELIEKTARDAATSYVDGAIAAGRVGVKPQRDRYIAMHMRDPDNATALIGSLPIVKGGATITGDPAPAADGIGEADSAVIALMGLDRGEYAKTLKDQKEAVL